mmetsp:Transcript_32877/g.83230  ORF Transcript_32877/g.83230 Transcript_32877/m.83230 type:complete len:317 (+) Transcript_32877:75-1025(+)|eukprot:CAMPEP_0115253844 /NCGR_PEP_ID=MMETSP0270-20121206/44882_1 /TAXON_ID=71861 /ORGANISM="Scrippsiella trochoidea, Strain CCMP3099" /LENGTH=316 /DNA_ID=CAMNT_0002669363 /DNA_START=71 /DNA_END=1021 /DNA_ORIENTATION=+
MHFPAQALLQRLRVHSDAQWASYMPARFCEGADVAASMLGAVPSTSRSTGRTPSATPHDLRGGASGRVGGGGNDVAGRVWRLSMDARGCHRVQQALEEASEDERLALARELQGHIHVASRCPHANFVVQKCITTMTPKMSQFIIDELMQDSTLFWVARHKYGCRIVQRLLENCPSEQLHDLIELLLDQFSEISRHTYGSFVMQKLVQYAAREQRIRLVELVEQHVSELAYHRQGSQVLCAALEKGDLADRCKLAEMVLKNSDQVVFVADTRHGHNIITNLLDVLDSSKRQQLMAILEGNPILEKVLSFRPAEGSVN